jgi:hypothetical protein
VVEIKGEFMDTKWISVDDLMPNHGVKVIAHYKNGSFGKNRTVMAHYLEPLKEESNSDIDCNDEYDEKTDNYYLKSDWYELIDNWDDYTSVVIHEGEVTHWMPIPIPPESK